MCLNVKRRPHSQTWRLTMMWAGESHWNRGQEQLAERKGEAAMESQERQPLGLLCFVFLQSHPQRSTGTSGNFNRVESQLQGRRMGAACQSASGNPDSLNRQTLSSFAGTNFCLQFFSTQSRSLAEVAYWSGFSCRRVTICSNSVGCIGWLSGASPCDHE